MPGGYTTPPFNNPRSSVPSPRPACRTTPATSQLVVCAYLPSSSIGPLAREPGGTTPRTKDADVARCERGGTPPLVSDLPSDGTPSPSLPRERTMPLPGQTGTSASRAPCPHLGMIETRLRAGAIDSERAPDPSGATFRGRDTPGTRCGAGRRSSSWAGPTRFSWAEPIGDRLLGAIWRAGGIGRGSPPSAGPPKVHAQEGPSGFARGLLRRKGLLTSCRFYRVLTCGYFHI